MSRIYLDHAATTPVRSEVLEEMLPLLMHGGNASVMYASGRKARQTLENSRERIASCIGAKPAEIFFTSGGTESDNWALQSAIGGRLVTSRGEHHAVLDTAAHLPDTEIEYIEVDATGRVDLNSLRYALTKKTEVVSVMHANNEVGTIQPLEEISALARAQHAIVHTDAVASLGKISVNVEQLGVDLLSGSAHKFYGPPGVGFLYIRQGRQIPNLIFGGRQERGARPGTQNVPGALGMAVALELAESERLQMERNHQTLSRRLREKLKEIEGIRFCGDPESSLPGLVHFLLPGIRSEAALISLDRMGFECAAGAACSQGAQGPSHVLLAMGIAPDEAACAVRVSFGRETTEDAVDKFFEGILQLVSAHRLR